MDDEGAHPNLVLTKCHTGPAVFRQCDSSQLPLHGGEQGKPSGLWLPGSGTRLAPPPRMTRVLTRGRIQGVQVFRARSHRLRGVSLFEAKLVGAAAAVVLLGVGVFVNTSSAEEKVSVSTKDANVILEAASDYMSEDGSGCPTVSSLKRDQLLQPNAAASDAWGSRFRVLCTGRDVQVLSAGPDGRLDSKDDVRATRSRS